MRAYTITYTVFGVKFKKVIFSKSPIDAQLILRGNIMIDKIQEGEATKWQELKEMLTLEFTNDNRRMFIGLLLIALSVLKILHVLGLMVCSLYLFWSVETLLLNGAVAMLVYGILLVRDSIRK